MATASENVGNIGSTASASQSDKNQDTLQFSKPLPPRSRPACRRGHTHRSRSVSSTGTHTTDTHTHTHSVTAQVHQPPHTVQSPHAPHHTPPTHSLPATSPGTRHGTRPLNTQTLIQTTHSQTQSTTVLGVDANTEKFHQPEKVTENKTTTRTITNQTPPHTSQTTSVIGVENNILDPTPPAVSTENNNTNTASHSFTDAVTDMDINEIIGSEGWQIKENKKRIRRSSDSPQAETKRNKTHSVSHPSDQEVDPIVFIRGKYQNIIKHAQRRCIQFKQDFDYNFGKPIDVIFMNKRECLKIKCRNEMQKSRLLCADRIGDFYVEASLPFSEQRRDGVSTNTEPTQPRLHKTIIHGVYENIPDDEILDHTGAQTVFKLINKLKLQNTDVEQDEHCSVILGFTDTPPPVVHIGFSKFNTKLYIPRPIRCDHCQTFGHTTSNCPIKEPTCSYCAGKHTYPNCPDRTGRSKPTCSNCKGQHSAAWTGCPKYLVVQEALEIREKENILFKHALQIAESKATQPQYIVPSSSLNNIPPLMDFPSLPSTTSNITLPQRTTSKPTQHSTPSVASNGTTDTAHTQSTSYATMVAENQLPHSVATTSSVDSRPQSPTYGDPLIKELLQSLQPGFAQSSDDLTKVITLLINIIFRLVEKLLPQESEIKLLLQVLSPNIPLIINKLIARNV